MGFSACGEASVELDQGLVPAEGGRQRCGEEGAAQASPAAGDMPLTFVLSAVVVEGSEPCERCRLLAADAAEFGHADDDGERGALADAGNAEHEIEPAGEIVMGAQRLRRSGAVRPSRRAFRRAMSAMTMPPQPGIVDMLEPGLETRDILFDLLDEGQMVGKRGQPRIRLDPRPLDRGRAGCDQNRIERIVLGAAQMQARISARTWIGCSTRTAKPAARRCLTTPRS